MSDIMNDSLVY